MFILIVESYSMLYEKKNHYNQLFTTKLFRSYKKMQIHKAKKKLCTKNIFINVLGMLNKLFKTKNILTILK